jgi:alpha-acetolactate decarboxylase
MEKLDKLSISDMKFFKAIREDKKRVEQEIKNKIKKFMTSENANSEFKLHDGFNKMCGLRGS